jgi:cytochrome d ubiquinol oxidase subunit II
VLIGVLLTGYFILDGFDLGVGILHLFVKGDENRRIVLNSIGPLWDGNEVWLVTFGGALFAAFPNAYALAFSGFYLIFMAVLCALIFRAVSIEFRSKNEHPRWRGFWDFMFSLSSAAAAFLFGTMVGRMLAGIPLNAEMEYTGSLLGHFTPYSCVTGIFAMAACAMHGCIFLYLKTEGDLQKQIHKWMWTTFGLFIVMYMLTTIFTLVELPHAIVNFKRWPWAWGVVFLNVLAIANIPRAIFKGKPGYAFLSSCCTLAALTFLFGVAMYPNLIVSQTDPSFTLNIYNASSSEKTLGIMLIVALLGMPCVLSYTAVVHWIFRGKVQLGKTSY